MLGFAIIGDTTNSDGGNMGYVNPDILVSPKWLNEHLDDPNLVIVDCPWEYYY